VSRFASLSTLLATFLTLPIVGQQKLPVPEYYGFYAVVDGKLIKLDSANGVHQVKLATIAIGAGNSLVDVIRGQPATVPPQIVQVIEFPSDVKFIAYGGNGQGTPEGAIHSFRVTELKFVRNLTIDTGYPQNIRRTGPENGWDFSGGGMDTGEKLQNLELLAKPMPDQKDMFVLGFEEPLKPGIYRLFVQGNDVDQLLPGSERQGVLFAVQPVEESKSVHCFDKTLTFLHLGRESETHFSPCSGPIAGSSASTASPNLPASSTAPPTATTPGTCSDYKACLASGISLYKARDFTNARQMLDKAVAFQPEEGVPFNWIGWTMIETGEIVELEPLHHAWNQALSLGAAVSIPACHDIAFKSCNLGSLQISAKRALFVGPGESLSLPGTDIQDAQIHGSQSMGIYFLRVKAGGKTFNFEFMADFANCEVTTGIRCSDPAAMKQQAVLMNYAAQTLKRVQAGTIVASSGATTASSNPAPVKPQGCGAIDAPYSLFSGGHLYHVKIAGQPGPKQQPYFFGENGSQLTDAAILPDLATAVWMHDNVIAAPDTRNSGTRIKDVLDTSAALDTYTRTQDVLARTMVEAVAAELSGGASLDTAVPRLTRGIVYSEISRAPVTVLKLTGYTGLNESKSAYESLGQLPPSDSTVLSVQDLNKLKVPYYKARGLELAYTPLVVKLLVQRAGDLTNQAVSSALSEIGGSGLFGADAGNVAKVSTTDATQVTLRQLLRVQTQISSLGNSLKALEAYKENLALGLNVAAANDATISAWAQGAAKSCK
jgi:hypothetical protein